MHGITSDTDLYELADQVHIKLNSITFKNELPYIPHVGSYIINMADSTDGSGGTHWVCVKLEDGVALYFDPFGVGPPKPVYDFMMKWVHNDTKKMVINQRDVQNISSNYCGQWSIACLAALEYTPGTMQQRLNEFLSSFRDYNSP